MKNKIIRTKQSIGRSRLTTIRGSVSAFLLVGLLATLFSIPALAAEPLKRECDPPIRFPSYFKVPINQWYTRPTYDFFRLTWMMARSAQQRSIPSAV